MATCEGPKVVRLIPPVPPALWSWPAVLNFALGGLGSGLYLVAALAAGFRPSSALTRASWLGPTLVLAGVLAVASEAGRPLRGPRLLTPRTTSWLSRELWLGGAFGILALDEFAFSAVTTRFAAALAAAAGATPQGLILARARRVAAWKVPLMPALLLLSALLGGAGAFLIVEVAGGRDPVGAVLSTVLGGLDLGGGGWLAWLTQSSGEAFARATRDLRESMTATASLGAGYPLPFALGAAALALPAAARWATPLAGLAMIAGQVRAKTAILRRAGQLRPITLAGPALERRSS